MRQLLDTRRRSAVMKLGKNCLFLLLIWILVVSIMASQDKRKRAIIHSPLAPGVVTQIPGREEAPGEDAVLTDYSNSRPLLAYTKDQFTTRKVSEMLDAYAPPASGKPASKLSCDDDFGSGLVKRWRDTKQEWCSAVGQASRDASGGGRAGGSTLTCYFIKQTEHGGDGDNLCVLENMSIDLSAFSDESVTKKVMNDYKSSSHNDEAYIHFGKGTVQAQCKMDTTNYNQNKFPGWNADWLYTGLDYSEQPHDRLACQVWEDTPTLIIQRDTFANMYHDTEDFVNAFLALAILELPLKNVQVFLTDLYPWGPFEAIWRQAFGFGNAALTAWEVKDKYGGKRVCFKQAIVGVYGPASPFCIMATDTGCQSSPLMRAYSDFVTRGMDLARYTYNVHKKPSPVVVINWMARRSSVKWPERTFCDEHYFKCNLFQHLKERSLSRVVTNDKECVQHLKKVAEDTKVDGKVLFFIDADYNLLPFEMQMRYNLMTDILIGPHGAGLTHQMFLPDRARVIELFVDGSSANRHFHNMARWRGRSGDMYQGVDIENPVPLKKVEDLVVGAVRKLAVDKY
jgi:protein O-GlcNAc transferase